MNKRVAEQIEAAHKTALAKGEVGIRDRAPIPTLQDFAEEEFLPFVESRFKDKPKTFEYYKNGIKNLTGFPPLANSRLDTITTAKITAFVTKRREAGLQVTSINRLLEVLRRMQKLATEWGKVNTPLPKVELLPGEKHRDRVLTADEETRYMDGTRAVGEAILQAYQNALEGTRATVWGEQPTLPADPFLLRDVATVLLDCGLRPDECFRPRWEHVRYDALHVPYGKTENARRTIPLTPRPAALIEMRRTIGNGQWVFPAPTRSGHMEKSTLKKQHPKAYELAKVAPFSLYTFRHTCLTRWAEYMDPFTLAYLAGHSDFSTTRRYIHPQAETVRAAVERARSGRGGHSSGHNDEKVTESQKRISAGTQ